MAGTYLMPKAFNRRFFINIGTTQAKQWVEIARGIKSRGTSISETTTDYYDMASRGVVESETESIKVQRSFSGCRALGDAAQDSIIKDRLYALDQRAVEYVDFYDNLTEGEHNGEMGTANITISDDGSGDANARENIAFALNISGTPKRCAVSVAQDGTLTFAAASAK